MLRNLCIEREIYNVSERAMYRHTDSQTDGDRKREDKKRERIEQSVIDSERQTEIRKDRERVRDRQRYCNDQRHGKG